MCSKKIIIPRYIIPVFFLFFNAIMIIFTKEIFFGAKNGLEIWINTVIPSLFPFMVSAGFAVNSGLAQWLGGILAPFSLKIFGLGAAQSFVFLTGLTAGCPVGLKTLADLYRRGDISRREAHRLMLFCNNTGIMFILSTVGTGFWQNEAVGKKLLLCSLISVFTLALLSGIAVKKQSAVKIPLRPALAPDAATRAVSDSVHGILTVGAYIIIFSVISQIFDILHIYDGLAAFFAPLGLDKNLCRAAAVGVLEITNGCKTAANGTKAGFILSAAIIGWGGLSIHAQSIAFLKDTDLSVLPYLAGKAMTAALCAFFALVLF